MAADQHGRFIWGVSTSSYQIEGAAEQDGRGPSIWDTFCHAGRVANGETADIACDHYHRFAEDVALMRDLGVGAYRFSISWPRVLPTGHGTPNEAGLAFYDRLIDALLAAGIEPWLCLYHWDLPQALEDVGGWSKRESAVWFADYAALAGRRYGDRVRHVATFNEPSVFTLLGYGRSKHPPGICDDTVLRRVIHHVNLAHGAAVDALRAAAPKAALGCIHCRQPCVPAAPPDAAAARRVDEYWNGAFPDPQCLGGYPPMLAREIEPELQAGDLERICRPVDWFGLNHYSPIYVRADAAAPQGFAAAEAPPEVPRSGIDWPIDPAAFREILLAVHARYRLPIYVTENGFGALEAPDAAGEIVDSGRIAYLEAYIGAMQEALRAGADVRGYFVWSLLDNFEWSEGYGPRFGLVYVDYPTLRRIPKASYRWYAEQIRQWQAP